MNLPLASITASIQKFKMLTYPNQISFIYFGHSASHGGLQRFYSIMGILIDFPLNYAQHVAVQQDSSLES